MDQDVPALVTLLLRVSVATSVSVCDNEISEDGSALLAKVPHSPCTSQPHPAPPASHCVPLAV